MLINSPPARKASDELMVLAVSDWFHQSVKSPRSESGYRERLEAGNSLNRQLNIIVFDVPVATGSVSRREMVNY